MDNAVALVQAYLRINGNFTVAEYPVLEARRHQPAQMATDIDLLAFRFPGAVRQLLGRRAEAADASLSLPDPELEVPRGAPDMIIGEVKEGRARLNKSMRNPSVIAAALTRFGCCRQADAEATAQRLLHKGRAETGEGHEVRIVVFASGGDGDARFQVVSLGHVVAFLRGYLRHHWSLLSHVQFRDPVLGLLMTLEKAGESAPGVRRS